MIHLCLLIGTFRKGPQKIWHQLSTIQKNRFWWGPMEPSALNPFFCSVKPGEVVNLNLKTVHKLQSHLRAKGIKARRGRRNYVALHQWSKSFPLSISGKPITDTHRYVQLPHVVKHSCGCLPSAGRGKKTHLAPNRQMHTVNHIIWSTKRAYSNGCSKHKQLLWSMVHLV